MHVAVYLPLLAAGILGVAAPTLARRLPPPTATRLLVAAGVMTAAASSFALAVLAFVLLAQLGPVAALGPWSARALGAASPVPPYAATAAVVAVCVLTVAGSRTALLRARALVAARALCLSLGGEPRQLIVVDDDVDVFAVPVARGRIIASRPLLAALGAPERRAVLAHETAHLAHHHHSYRLAADMVAAVNPLLRPLAAAVRYSTERWADEVAATSVGDRRVVARAVARAALRARSGRPVTAWSAVALEMAPSPVVGRVQALLAPVPRRRPMLVVAVVVLLAVTLSASAETKQDTERLFERSMTPAAVGQTF